MDGDRLAPFLDWVQENGIQLRGCTIKKGPENGFGVFSSDKQPVEGIYMVTPLELAITPMTVLQDQLLGSIYQKTLENEEVDERLLVMIFLMVERAKGISSFFFPYIQMLPSSFGTPLWFTEDELKELEGTTLYQATKVQLNFLRGLFDDKVKEIVETIMTLIDLDRKIEFEDFLWSNCIFWTRALNIPFPKDSVPHPQKAEANIQPHQQENTLKESDVPEQSTKDKNTLWVEGLVPGIDFCNHNQKAVALWEVDGRDGLQTGVPCSMYLVAGADLKDDSQIYINYGNKGNEELLFLYGFVVENNPDDYLMLHFPQVLVETTCCLETKMQLLEEQNLLLRWLLPGSYLEGGFLRASGKKAADDESGGNKKRNIGYSWSGLRKPPAYLDLLVFPQEMMSALRVVAMTEDEVENVVRLLEELSHIPSNEDIEAAVWEVCGDFGAFQLLVELLSMKMREVEECSGREDEDAKILELGEMSENKRSCVIYRKGQKYLVGNFLREAKVGVELCASKEV